MIFEHQAACPLCGQMLFISTTKQNESEEFLAEQAADKCDCEAASVRRGMRDTEAAIHGVLGRGGAKPI